MRRLQVCKQLLQCKFSSLTSRIPPHHRPAGFLGFAEISRIPVFVDLSVANQAVHRRGPRTAMVKGCRTPDRATSAHECRGTEGQESYKPPGRKPRGTQWSWRQLQGYGELTVRAATYGRSEVSNAAWPCSRMRFSMCDGQSWRCDTGQEMASALNLATPPPDNAWELVVCCSIHGRCL